MIFFIIAAIILVIMLGAGVVLMSVAIAKGRKKDEEI